MSMISRGTGTSGGSSLIAPNELIKKQTVAERHFFRVAKSVEEGWPYRDKCNEISDAFTKARAGVDKSETVQIRETPLRVEIIADALSSSKALVGKQWNDKGYLLKSEEPMFPVKHTPLEGSYRTNYSRVEHVECKTPRGSQYITTSAQKVTPHQNHKGDFRLDFHHSEEKPEVFLESNQGDGTGKYVQSSNGIIEILSSLNIDKQKRVAELFLTLGDSPKTISPKSLKSAGFDEKHSESILQLQRFFLENKELGNIIREKVLLEMAEGRTTLLEGISNLPTLSDEDKRAVDLFCFKFEDIIRESSPDKAKSLSSFLLKSLEPTKKRRPIKKEDLDRLEIPEKLLNFLNDLYYLLFIKEISRRLYPSNETMNLPYSLSLIRALKLVGKTVENCRIDFKEILDPGDDGLLFFTQGSFLRENNPEKPKKKIAELNRLYQIAFPEEKEVSEKAMGRTLCRYFGGGSDTDEDGYCQH